MNYEAIYSYRFGGIDQGKRQAVWNQIAPFIYSELGSPRRVLDPAAGRGEFINAIPGADERWVIDEVDYPERRAQPGVKVLISDVMTASLPENYFDGVFVSNFLEHLPTHRNVADFLKKMHGVLSSGGRIAVLGPNFKYCADKYFDCADHTLALTHVSVTEHLHGAGFHVEKIVPRFLPFSFRGALPASSLLTRLYLKSRVFWPLFGEQFLIIGAR